MLKLKRLLHRLPFFAEHQRQARNLFDEQVLWHTLPRRHAALLGSSRQAEAMARHQDWLTRSASYQACCEEGDARLSDYPADQTTIAGLQIHVPADSRKPSSLSYRILNQQWLPLREILLSRELAVGTAMIDIGANIGTTSIPRVILGDFQHIYAAEPAPANYAALVQNLAVNQLLGFVLPDRVALGAADGEVWLKTGAQMGGHRLADPNSMGRRSRARLVQVPCWTLDHWVAHMGINLDLVMFIKCDTQGSEGAILRGAPEVLSKKHIAWQIEFWPEGLSESGFTVDELAQLIEEHFSHFIDLWDEAPGERVQRTQWLHTALAPYREGKSFTELLLFNA